MEDQIQKDEFGIPIKKKDSPSQNVEKDEFGIPVKKKSNQTDPITSSDDGSKTLKISEVISGQQKVSPSPSASGADDRFSMKGFNLKPVSTNFLTKGLSLNDQGYIGNGAKKSNLLKAVDDQFQIHLPVTPNSKQAVDNITKAFQENDIEKIKETRDYVIGKQETKKFDAQEQNRRNTLSSVPVGQPLPIDLKVASDIAHNQIQDSFQKDIAHSKDVFDNYMRYAITDKHINPPDQAAKEKLKGFESKPEVSKQVYKAIGEELTNNKLPLNHDRTGNSSYDNTRAGLESVIDNMQMEANDLISEGKKTNNITLLNLAKQKAAQIDAHKKVLNGLADEYPDVMALNTARYLGDVMNDLGYNRKVAISTEDVYEAAEVIKKEHPEAYKKIEKYIKPIAESEGSGIMSLLPGQIPSAGVGAQLEQSIESFIKEKAGQVSRFESIGKPSGISQSIQQLGAELQQSAESPLLQGPSQSGGLKSKIVLSDDGTFIEKPNENYGVINWNNAVRSITHALPGLAEWITLERAGGAIIGKALEGVAGLSEVGKATSVGGKLSEDALSLAPKPSFNKTGGLITASLATGYEPSRRLADELIDDKSGWGDAKKNAFAVINSMVTAGVFHLLDASPNKIITESFQKGISKSVLKTLEEGNFQNITEEGMNKILNEAYPLGERLLKSAGKSLKEGTTIAGAGQVSEKLNQLSAAIVNPKKANFGDAEDNVKGFIGQALTMSLLPAIGHIVAKGGEMPYMAKDALYDAAIHDNIMVDDIHEKVKSGEYTQDQGIMMVKAIKSFKDSIVSAQLQTTKDGTPLSNKQVKDWAAQDFRLKLKDLFKQEGKEPEDAKSVDIEVKAQKEDILKESDYHKLEDSEIFKSIKPVAESADIPEKYLDIDPNKKYSITVGGEDKVVMGDTLQRILSDPDNYVKAKPEEITQAIELRPEITQENLTDDDFARVKELDKKINPVIENGKVVKPGEALTKSEEEEYNSILEKRNGKPYTEYDFKGLRDDDFAKKYLTEREYNKWHELDKNDDPEAKKIISEKKQELLSQPKIENDGKRKENASQGGQERDVLVTPEKNNEGAGEKSSAPIENPTKDDLQPTIVVNGKEYTGDNHAEAMNKAIAAGEDVPSPDTKEGKKWREENGMFKDKDGNLLSRDQTEEKFGIRNSHELLPIKSEEPKTTEGLVGKAKELNKSTSAIIAPFFDQQVSSAADAKAIEKSPAYKQHIETIKNVAKGLGIKIKNIGTTLGRYVNKYGEIVDEVSTSIELDTDDIEKTTEFAAVMGALAPETQESTIAAQYISESDENGPRHTGDMHSLTEVSDLSYAVEAAKEAGLNFTADVNTSSIHFLEFLRKDWFNNKEFKEKLTKFVSKLKEGGIKYDTETRAVESRLIESGGSAEHEFSRKDILRNIGKQEGMGQGGDGIRNAVSEAIKRNDEFIRQEGLADERKEYGALREKQIELQNKGENLSDSEVKRLTELYDKLLPGTEETVANAKDSYEQAKSEIDQVAKEVVKGSGFVAEFPIKRIGRAAVKILRWYKGKAQWIGDGARSTVIVYDKADIMPTYDKLQQVYEGGIVRNETEDTELGYPKKLMEVRTSNGKIAEFQVMTPDGYLAKDGVKYFPKDHQDFAKEELAKIQQKLGWKIPDGIGHYFYEINRDFNVPKELRDEAKRISVDYYDAMLHPEDSKLTEGQFKSDLAALKEKVDAADKSSWDKGNEGMMPNSGKEFLGDPAAVKEWSPSDNPPPPPPTIPPIKTVENTGTPQEEWTAIRKEKQKEIDEVREAYEQQKRKSWSESMRIGLEKVQSKYPDKSLYDAAISHRDDILSGGYVSGFEPDESLAVMQYLKDQIASQRAELSKDLISDNEEKRRAAIVQDAAISGNYIDTALAIKDLTTGFARGLNYAQSELTFDPEYGLQIRRMELARDTPGNYLSDEDLAETARLFELEKETYQREAEAKIKAMQEKFDSEMSKMKKRDEGKQKQSEEAEPKNAKERKEKLLKQSGKDFADKLRAGKIKGTFSDPLLVGQTLNTVIDALAFAVEKGATLAQAIKDYIDEHKIKDAASFTKGILNHIDREDSRAETLDKIKEIATLNKVEDIHGNMVSKNLIRDYVNSFIGTVEQKDILQTATDGLKEILPGVAKEKLIEAYLKEGEFKQKTSKELGNGISSDTRSLANIAKLEEDISDLKVYKELRQRNFPTDRERTEYEKQLEKDKEGIIKQRREDKAQFEKQYKQIESERNRQLSKIEELKQKRDKLRDGIREKTEKKVTVDTPEIEGLKKEVDKADKDLRDADNAVRKVERDAENKRKKISEINADIERLKEKGELFRKSKGKSEKEIDKDIKAKQDELKRVMIDKGVKTSTVDKYTKASFEARAKAHNDRLSDLSKRVENMVLSEDLTDEQKRALTLLKERLDNGIVKLDENSALSQERVLSHGLELVKQAKSEFDRTADRNIKEIGPIKAGLQRIIDQYTKDIDSTNQDIALERLKKRLANEKDEYNRRINAGEFEDNPIVELTKADAELIKIQRDRNIIMGEYDKLKRKHARESETGAKKLTQTARSLVVTSMIWKGVTLAKVASSAFIRPQLEALTKLFLGRAYEKYISPTIAHIAKAGGESESLASIKKGYQAFLSKYTEADIEKKIEASNNNFENADEAYRNGLDVLGKIDDKRTKEYKDLYKDVSKLKEKRDAALVENTSWQLFGYLSPNAFSEAWQILLHRSADIEREFGFFDSEQLQKLSSGKNYKEKAMIGLDNLEYVTNFVGRSHGALKNFSARQSFASGFLARLEYAVKEGVDVTSPDKILEIANESYLDYERGKYQQYNQITDKFNKVMGFVDREVSPAVAALARTEVAITRVPVNQLWEAIAEYGVGAFTSSWETAKQYYKAKGIALKEGYTPDQLEEFKDQIKKNISENLTPKEAATIVRSFRKGGMGMGLYALGLIGGVGFGGFPHKGQTADDKKIAKREIKTGVKELKTGELQIGSMKVPEIFSKIAEHTPALYPMLFGISLSQVYKNNVKLGKSTAESIKNDAVAHINVILDGIPQYKLISPIAESIGQYAKSFAEVQGVDKDGNIVKLKPFRLADIIQMLPFGDRSKMLSPVNYKLAMKVQKDFETQQVIIENDANISDAEKKQKLSDLEEEKENLINQIYESQKH